MVMLWKLGVHAEVESFPTLNHEKIWEFPLDSTRHSPRALQSRCDTLASAERLSLAAHFGHLQIAFLAGASPARPRGTWPRCRLPAAGRGSSRTPNGPRPLLEARNAVGQQVSELDRKVMKLARHDAQVRRFMTVPGVGPITALAFKATIDDPARFARSRSVGAYVGLTSRRHASGEVDWSAESPNAATPCCEVICLKQPEFC
jgi:hypothetical protein